MFQCLLPRARSRWIIEFFLKRNDSDDICTLNNVFIFPKINSNKCHFKWTNSPMSTGLWIEFLTIDTVQKIFLDPFEKECFVATITKFFVQVCHQFKISKIDL